MRPGGEGDKFYLVRSGRLLVYRVNLAGENVPPAEMGPGSKKLAYTARPNYSMKGRMSKIKMMVMVRPYYGAGYRELLAKYLFDIYMVLYVILGIILSFFGGSIR